MLGLHPNTLRRYADQGKINHYRNEAGQRLYDVESYLRGSMPPAVVCYCRVSSHKQKADLERQIGFMQGRYPDAEIISDIGGGLNWRRKGLISLLERLHSGDKLKIVVAHKDRLARFGFELLEWMVQRNGGEIMVLNRVDASPESEITADILAILHTYSARLHGLRRYRNAIEADTNLSQLDTETDDSLMA